MHRIHHSVEKDHIDRNFAAFFPFWDIVFRTYRKPRKDEWPQTGVRGEPDVRSVAGIIGHPFAQWTRFARRKLARAH